VNCQHLIFFTFHHLLFLFYFLRNSLFLLFIILHNIFQHHHLFQISLNPLILSKPNHQTTQPYPFPNTPAKPPSFSSLTEPKSQKHILYPSFLVCFRPHSNSNQLHHGIFCFFLLQFPYLSLSYLNITQFISHHNHTHIQNLASSCHTQTHIYLPHSFFHTQIQIQKLIFYVKHGGRYMTDSSGKEKEKTKRCLQREKTSVAV